MEQKNNTGQTNPPIPSGEPQVIRHANVVKLGTAQKVLEVNLTRRVRAIEYTLPKEIQELAMKILGLFTSREGHRFQWTEESVIEALPKYDCSFVERVIQDFLEADILYQVDGSDLLELSGNFLSRQVAGKVQAERLQQEKVENFIHARYQNRKKTGLLTYKDLNYVTPFLNTLELSDAERAYVKKSQRYIKYQRWVRTAVIIGVISILTAIATFAYRNSILAGKESDRARKQEIIAQREKATADSLRRVATLHRDSALIDRDKAHIEKERADSLATVADEERAFALAQRDSANFLRQKAIEARKAIEDINEKLEQANNDLESKKLEVETALENEGLARRSAEQQSKRNKKLADDLINVSQAKSIASKSREMKNSEKELKALLALEAFKIYRSTDLKNIPDPDIFSALYYGLKSVEIDDYNSVTKVDGMVKDIVFEKSGTSFWISGGFKGVEKFDFSPGLDPMEVGSFSEPKIEPYNRKGTVNSIFNHLAISQDGSTLVEGGQWTWAGIYNLASNSHTSKELFDFQEIYDLALNQNGSRLYFSGANGSIKSAQINQVKPQIFTYQIINSKVLSFANDYLAVGTKQGSVYLIGEKTNPQQLINTGENSEITAIQLEYQPAQNAYQLAIGFESGLIKVYELTVVGIKLKWGTPQDLETHNAIISDLDFDANCKFLVATSYDGRASLWDLAAVKNQEYFKPIILDDFGTWATAVAFIPGKDYVLVGARDGINGTKGVLKYFATAPETYACKICNSSAGSQELTQKQIRQNIGYTKDDNPFMKPCADICQ